jgi:hypothetical protein
MKVLIRYKVKPDEAAKNAELVRAVFKELEDTKPAGIRYATFQLEDGVSFVHLFSQDTAENPLQSLPAFAEFQEGIADRCEEQPAVTALKDEVGSYRFFGA